MTIEIWTDGACSKNGHQGAIGGWGFVIIDRDQNDKILIERAGAEKETTNQRMELIAAIKGCLSLETLGLANEAVTIFSDSAYLINCKTQRWYQSWKRNGWINSKKQPVANQDLWEQLIPYFEKSNIIWQKVKGHTGNKWNEYVDKFAVQAREKI